jgi:hypothetical protein
VAGILEALKINRQGLHKPAKEIHRDDISQNFQNFSNFSENVKHPNNHPAPASPSVNYHITLATQLHH